MSIKAYWDDDKTITAELDRIYYDGDSRHFTIIDNMNTYVRAEIIQSVIMDHLKRYTLRVEGLEIGSAYTIADERFLKSPLIYRNILKTDFFDRKFYYEGKDLGSSYSPEQTVFKVWSPISSRMLVDIEGWGIQEMIRGDKGVFESAVQGDFDGFAYQYVAENNGHWHSANDPYGYSSTANTDKSVIINLQKLNIELNKETLPLLKQKTDAVIYELHVRDMSSLESSGIKQKGKFLGLTEEKTHNNRGDSTGLDYLTELGITHIQLMPVYDFGTVDEIHPETHYNWGYDPVHFNIPEGSYGSDITDPYSRMIDLQKMISTFHSKGLRVIMDVVYNHMFDRDSSDFENLVPYYYFRTGDDGEPSNGSFCSNDLDSTRPMVRKYILESLERWMKIYGMDGFRFDLMGILDIETMNQVASLVKSIDPSAIVYGEGWNMPTLLADDQKATMMNQEQMPDISHFNDYFRDAVKGDTMLEKIDHRGFMTGSHRHLEKLPNLLLGSRVYANGSPFFSAPVKSVNYVECHDNHTTFDKMTAAGIKKEEILPRQKLMLAAVLFSRGIPFLHSGQEMCRTKGGDHNSYKSSDAINGIDWDRRSEFRELVEFVKDAISLRKETALFRKAEYDDDTEIKVDKHGKTVEIQYSDNTILIMNLGNHNHEID
ncbi:MAG: type I pullulanase, partial [Spirochaetaceae bacterium]|nr:type I pullulanase [Spirochaetaceae bacterium]